MSGAEPKYLGLYRRMRGEILGGIWPSGARLPSRRQIAAESGVSLVTAEHAYDLLCQEGYAEARARSGYYVCYRAEEGFSMPAARREPPPATRHGGGDGDGFPFSVLARTMRRVLSDAGEAILERTPGQGSEALRGALSRYLARSRGIHAREEQIVLGAGAEYLYGLVVELLGRDRAFGVESPSYAKIEQVYRAKGVACELLPLDGEGIAPEAIAATGADVLHVTPFRSYPSGVTASASRRAAYLRWASAPGRYLVEDDCESEFSLLRKPEETLYSWSDRGNVLYMNTFSRTVSPAIRVGYLVLPEALLERYRERVGFYACPVPAFEQLVLAELIESGDFERHIERIRRRMRRQREAEAEKGLPPADGRQEP